MEWLWLLGKGVVIGFAIALPVGPVGVLCIRRSLHDGLIAGLVCGLGAATADTVYGAIAGFGLVSIIGLLHAHQDLIRLIGGLLLCLFGIKLLLTVPSTEAKGNGSYRLAGAYVSCFVLALTNPATIFAFLAVFASLGLADEADGYGAASLLTAGVFLGAALWWFLLSAGAGLLRDRVTLSGLKQVNRASGGLVLAFGLLALAAYAGWVSI